MGISPKSRKNVLRSIAHLVSNEYELSRGGKREMLSISKCVAIFTLIFVLTSYYMVAATSIVKQEDLSHRTSEQTSLSTNSKIGFEAPEHSVTIFDYLSKTYIYYSHQHGPIEGDSPIFSGDKLNVSETTFNSPIVVVINPTNGAEDWILTLVDNSGEEFKFYIYKIETSLSVVSDFIVLWEDMFDPDASYTDGYDWRDHVVRITVFDHMVRVALYFAKGAFSHTSLKEHFLTISI